MSPELTLAPESDAICMHIGLYCNVRNQNKLIQIIRKGIRFVRIQHSQHIGYLCICSIWLVGCSGLELNIFIARVFWLDVHMYGLQWGKGRDDTRFRFLWERAAAEAAEAEATFLN